MIRAGLIMALLFLVAVLWQAGFQLHVRPKIQLVNPGKSGSLHVRVLVPKEKDNRVLCITVNSLDGTETGSCFPHVGEGAPLQVERWYHGLAPGYYNIYAILHGVRAVRGQRGTHACIAEEAGDCF